MIATGSRSAGWRDESHPDEGIEIVFSSEEHEPQFSGLKALPKYTQEIIPDTEPSILSSLNFSLPQSSEQKLSSSEGKENLSGSGLNSLAADKNPSAHTLSLLLSPDGSSQVVKASSPLPRKKKHLRLLHGPKQSSGPGSTPEESQPSSLNPVPLAIGSISGLAHVLPEMPGPFPSRSGNAQSAKKTMVSARSTGMTGKPNYIDWSKPTSQVKRLQSSSAVSQRVSSQNDSQWSDLIDSQLPSSDEPPDDTGSSPFRGAVGINAAENSNSIAAEAPLKDQQEQPEFSFGVLDLCLPSSPQQAKSQKPVSQTQSGSLAVHLASSQALEARSQDRQLGRHGNAPGGLRSGVSPASETESFGEKAALSLEGIIPETLSGPVEEINLHRPVHRKSPHGAALRKHAASYTAFDAPENDARMLKESRDHGGAALDKTPQASESNISSRPTDSTAYQSPPGQGNLDEDWQCAVELGASRQKRVRQKPAVFLCGPCSKCQSKVSKKWHQGRKPNSCVCDRCVRKTDETQNVVEYTPRLADNWDPSAAIDSTVQVQLRCAELAELRDGKPFVVRTIMDVCAALRNIDPAIWDEVDQDEVDQGQVHADGLGEGELDRRTKGDGPSQRTSAQTLHNLRLQQADAVDTSHAGVAGLQLLQPCQSTSSAVKHPQMRAASSFDKVDKAAVFDQRHRSKTREKFQSAPAHRASCNWERGPGLTVSERPNFMREVEPGHRANAANLTTEEEAQAAMVLANLNNPSLAGRADSKQTPRSSRKPTAKRSHQQPETSTSSIIPKSQKSKTWAEIFRKCPRGFHPDQNLAVEDFTKRSRTQKRADHLNQIIHDYSNHDQLSQ